MEKPKNKSLFPKASFRCLLFVLLIVETINTSWAADISTDPLIIRDEKLGLLITQSSSVLHAGDELEIVVTVINSSENRIKKINIGGSENIYRKKHDIVFKTTANTPGYHTIPVVVYFVEKEKQAKKEYTISYTVHPVNVAIALDRMNILYIGIDNPMTIAASGGSDDQITVSISGGGGMLSKVGTGKYNVRVSKPSDECVIKVFVDNKLYGLSQFKVRSLPLPIGTIGGFTSGDSVNAKAFAVQQGMGAYIADLPIDIRYEIIGYTLHIVDDKNEIKSADSKGAYFSEEAKQLIQQYVKPGKTVTIGNLFVKGPTDSLMKLRPLIYQIK